MKMHGTTIVAVHKDGVSAIAGDGQVTLGDTIMKTGAVKVREMADGQVLTGFAGATADAFTLLEKFEGYLSGSKNNLLKASVDMVKEWRTDRMLRNLEAMMLVADKERILLISGVGDVVSPDENVAATGSGGPYAQAAALALLKHSDMNAKEIAKTAIEIAASIDIYTTGNVTVLSVSQDEKAENAKEES